YLTFDILHYKESAQWNPFDFMIYESITFATTFVSAALVWWLEGKRRKFADHGLRPQNSLRLYLQGLIWGFALPGLAMLLIAAFGGVSFSGLFLHGNDLMKFT